MLTITEIYSIREIQKNMSAILSNMNAVDSIGEDYILLNSIDDLKDVAVTLGKDIAWQRTKMIGEAAYMGEILFKDVYFRCVASVAEREKFPVYRTVKINHRTLHCFLDYMKEHSEHRRTAIAVFPQDPLKFYAVEWNDDQIRASSDFSKICSFRKLDGMLKADCWHQMEKAWSEKIG